ncbi:lipase [Bacillus sp. DX1.1]|uniref:esterase/lipase family protein n=1 Tax=unclassified Bacillus (in: firmicutes) TaxID=185979 RepID=UPI00256FD7F3|nr:MULTISPECIES: lipase [unclassified Bacillus (in: firmicutes)]MDM5155146.1 lipase [Bacillus sp. DX1.1]WJE79474.1 lipase [Bacillus sp. DX3.1]
MRRLFGGFLILFFIVSCAIISSPVHAEEGKSDNNPIILVHGFTGWGRDELLGVKYWGGVHDIQENLKTDGYNVHTAAVGPLSSNWDRACELYTQINGGTVDYGAEHAAKHGHDRYGRTYTGFAPNWSETNKVHLVGHSMGGQTIRTLVQLLKEGSQEERNYAKQHADVQISPLFQGGKSYVHSVTTLATPHNGTTLADGSLLLPSVKQLLVATAGMGENNNLSLYDFKLDQWGIKKKAGESFLQYSNRVLNSSVWKGTKDISQWDLSTDGAKELNEWVKAQPDVYYFSYSGHATKATPITGLHLPHVTMNKTLMGNAIFLGSYARYEENRPVIDSSWWQNDGVVNTNSMIGPSTDEVINYNGAPQAGKWNHIETKHNWDHLDMVGLSVSDSLGFSDIHAFYRTVAERLANLPK